MPVERGRANWTDERLDDLARRMDQGFARIDEDLRSLSVRIDAQGENLGVRIDAQSASLNARIDAIQRTMLAMMATILIGFAGLIASQL